MSVLSAALQASERGTEQMKARLGGWGLGKSKEPQAPPSHSSRTAERQRGGQEQQGQEGREPPLPLPSREVRTGAKSGNVEMVGDQGCAQR